MELLPVYLRREWPDKDRSTFKQRLKGFMDVQAYRDAELTEPFGRWSYEASTPPRRGCKTVTLNCYKWRAVWMPDQVVCLCEPGQEPGTVCEFLHVDGEPSGWTRWDWYESISKARQVRRDFGQSDDFIRREKEGFCLFGRAF